MDRKIELQVLTTLDELRPLQADWKRLLEAVAPGEFFMSFEWVETFLRCWTASEMPLFAVIGRIDGGIMLIAPFVLTEKVRGATKLRQLEFLGAPYAAVRGALAEPGLEKTLAADLVQFLLTEHGGEWDLAGSWDLSPSNRFTTEFASELERRAIGYKNFPHGPNLVIDLSGIKTQEDYENSVGKITRKNVRQKTRRLTEEGACRFTVITSSDKLERALRDYHTVFQASWKPPELDQSFHNKFARSLADEGRLRLFFLYFKPGAEKDLGFDGGASPDFPENGLQPIAAQFVFLYGKTALFMRTFYDRDYNTQSAGSILLWQTIRHVAQHEQVERIDFLRGDEDYKQRFGGVLRETRYYISCANPASGRARWALRKERATEILNGVGSRVKQLIAPAKSREQQPAGESN